MRAGQKPQRGDLFIVTPRFVVGSNPVGVTRLITGISPLSVSNLLPLQVTPLGFGLIPKGDLAIDRPPRWGFWPAALLGTMNMASRPDFTQPSG